MNPGKRLTESKLTQPQDQLQEISSLWNSLGRLRTMNSEGTEHPITLNPLSGARRKVSRIVSSFDRNDDGSSTQRTRRAGPTEDQFSLPLARSKELLHHGKYDHSGLNGESPKRVDFSRTHQLREVNWDGTYQDRLTFPANSEGGSSSSNISSVINSRDSHFTNFPFTTGSTAAASSATASSLNTNSHGFTSPPLTPPPSVSNSTSDFHLITPPSSPSSSAPTSSSSTSPTTLTDQCPDVRWTALEKKTSLFPGTGTGKGGSGKNSRLKPTGIDLQAVSARTGHTSCNMNEPPAALQKNKGLPQTRKQVEEKWTSWGRPLNKAGTDIGQVHLKSSQLKAASGVMDTSRHHTVHSTEDSSLNNQKLPVPFKLPITADLKEDKIMLRLKEKLKQQRALVSSSGSASNDTSVASSSSISAPTPSATLSTKLPLTGDVRVLEKPRRIAASHSSVIYRGFSEVTSEAATPWRLNMKGAGVKKNGRQIKQPLLQPKKHELESVRQTVPQSSPERPKKLTRLIASGNKKSSKPGVTNIITTSSWRAGQDLILKELGLTSKVKNKPSDGSHGSRKTGSTSTSETEDRPHSQQPRDGDLMGIAGAVVATSGGDGKDSEKAVDEVMNNGRVLPRQDSSEEMKLKSPVRPAMKRKAPKATDPEKHNQPTEKTRHYDQDSVRKFMAKQKADRLKRQHEEKIASQKANERKQQIMLELAERQKQAARLAVAVRGGEGERKRKSDGRNKENMELTKQDQDDNSTLTEDTEDSTPRATPKGTTEDTSRQRKRSKDNELGVNTNQHALNVIAVTATSSSTSATLTDKRNTGDRVIEFRGQKMNLDVESILNQFAQVVKKRHLQGAVPATSTTSNERSGSSSLTEFQLQGSNVFTGTKHPDDAEIAFSLGTTNSMARTNEERKQAIKATALTLQSRLAEERRRMEGLNLENQKQHNITADFVSRYNRIAGKSNDFAVFTSDLPGSHAVMGGANSHDRQDKAATRIQAAYRGHNVRRALHWQLPSGRTLGQTTRKNQQKKNMAQTDDDGDDDSDLREPSTFSEVTAAEESDVSSLTNASRNSRGYSNRHQAEASVYDKPRVNTYKPTSPYTWLDSKPDPYSVMNVFSRQSRYLAAGSKQADVPFTANTSIITTTTTSTVIPAFIANLDLTSVKHPVITSSEQVTYGQPVITRALYTRVEAVLREGPHLDKWNNEIKSDSELSASESSLVIPSKHSHSHQTAVAHSRSAEPTARLDKHARRASEKSAYSNSFESSEDEVSNKSASLKSILAPSFKLQETEVLQDLDVSHLSNNELRSLRSKLGSAATYKTEVQVSTHVKPANHAAVSDARDRREPSGRLSPNSLANKFSANLNYLESMEESLRHVIGMERTRSVAIAQQETVSLAQILKSRQQEHNTSLQNLQLKAHREAKDSTQELGTMRARLGGRSKSTASGLLDNDNNRRPESWSQSLSISSRSHRREKTGKDYSADSSISQDIRHSSAASLAASIANGPALPRTKREHSFTSVDTEENIRTDLSSSSRTSSVVTAHDSQTGSIPEEVPEEEDSYSMSFDESFTEVLPSQSHRKAVRRQSGEFQTTHDDISSHITPYELSSLNAGENSFNKFTADMVRQIMREEQQRAHHQAALLSLREKALKEKAKTELAWLEQLKQKPLNKAADDAFPNLEKREQNIRKQLREQQTEIRRLQETNKKANRERKMLLQQHEEIARIKENTQQTLQKLLGTKTNEVRYARPADVHTEDENDKTSDVNEDIKDSKSDSEMYRDALPSRQRKRFKTNMEKQQKLRLDEKYMTAREQKLHERQKQAKELLEWKKRLDAEEERVFRLERKAIEAWEGKNKEKHEEIVTKKAPKPVSASKKDESNVISDHVLSSMHDELDGARSHAVKTSISEAISTQISISKTETTVDKTSRSVTDVKDKERLPAEVKDKEKSPTKVKDKERSPAEVKDKDLSPKTSGSEGSIPEEIPTGVTREKQTVDSSDDTLINSSANDEYADTFEHDGLSVMASRKKSPVGKLLLQGNSPLPSPWSRRTGSESESEDSISHTETVSDVSDYEVRIRQLSDELRRRRKEIEILKKERSRRKKEKLKAQEEAMQKQLEAYNKYIQQLKLEKDELEHESQLKTAVKPQIKQPRVGHHVKSKQSRRSEDGSVSFEDMRDSTDSNQTSPSIDGKDSNTSPVEERSRTKVSVKLMERLLEVSEAQSDKVVTSEEVRVIKASDSTSEKINLLNVDEVIEELSHLESYGSEKTVSDALKIQTAVPSAPDMVVSRVSDVKEEELSYSMDFSTGHPTMDNSHSRVQSAKSEESKFDKKGTEEISEEIEEQYTAKSQSVISPFKFNGKADQEETVTTAVTTGIQESDSETESRINSYHTSAKSDGSSRPSSERSLASISYSPEDEEEEDIISYGSDKMPSRPQNIPANSVSFTTEDIISEHISVGLPSISEKQRSHSGLLLQESLEISASLNYKEDEEEEDADKTPVATPRDMVSTPVPVDEDENTSLLATDPLADFCLGDRVLVGGRKLGLLRYKGKVDFSPGIWAGVELVAKEGESDGMHEGKRYFTCSAHHGVMVHGSDIMAASEQLAADVSEIEEALSPDESLTTDQDDSNIGDFTDAGKAVYPTPNASLLHSTPVSSPYQGSAVTEKPVATPVRKDMTLVADTITDRLTTSLVEDSVKTIERIVSKKSPPQTLPKPTTKTSSISETVKLTETSETRVLTSQEQSPAQKSTDKTTDGVMKSLLEEAISDILKVKRRKAASDSTQIQDFLVNNCLINGKYAGQGIKSFLDDSVDDEKIQDNDSGLSLDPIQRPGSPVPGDCPSVNDRKKLGDDLEGLFGEYIDDNFEFEQSTTTSKPPPPYPVVPEEIIPLVPHTKEEIAPIVTKSVEVYWEKRRYGESLEEVAVPPDFLSDAENDVNTDMLTGLSMKSWKHMLFDLTGLIIRDIYKSDDRFDVPVWQKAKHKSHKFFHGVNPPTTIEGLQPIVHAAVFKFLGLNGTRKYSTVNKWNIRKKKDIVDSILVQELGEEEMGWVDYDDDVLSLKMSLAESLFDSLIVDTVHTLNSIYQKRQHSQV